MPYKDPEANRERARERRREGTEHGQEISSQLAKIKNPSRRAKALKSYKFFARTYFPERFSKAWSDDHLKVIAVIEKAVLHGGKLIVAMPRGSGKTTLIEVACIWAILNGARKFVALIGSSKQAAIEMLDSVKAELSTNERLAEDFPREVGPFVCLEGEPRRCTGQRCDGQRTFIQWRGDTIVFATIKGSQACGAILRVAGITGRLRGMKFTRPDGKVARPDLCVPDDPQTDQSARSDAQTGSRETAIESAVRGMAGPGAQLSILMPVTVIRRGDLAERFFDRKRHPQWDGLRMKALYSFPSDMKLWETYANIYRECRERGVEPTAATAFYKKHRAAMDAGAKPAWPARFEPPAEISATQACMNLFFFSREAFHSEHQNEPEEDVFSGGGRITAEAVLQKLNGRPRGEVPKDCRWLVAHVDVHDEILYFQVLALAPGFTAATIDYGSWPGQPRRYFQQSDPPLPMSKVYTGRSREAVICAGLEELLQKHLLARRYPREQGGESPLDLVVIDAGYKPDEVARVLRILSQGHRLLPAKGFGIGPTKKPFTEYKPEAGQVLGRHWRKAVTRGTGLVTLEIDTNRWKSFSRDRVLAKTGDPGGWTCFGTASDAPAHQLLADHLAAEVPTEASGPWARWKFGPPRSANPTTTFSTTWSAPSPEPVPLPPAPSWPSGRSPAARRPPATSPSAPARR